MIDLNRKLTRTSIAVPGGRTVEEFRLGDYFDKIEVNDGVMAFHVKDGVDSTWKFLAVSLLREQREKPPSQA